MNVLTKYIIGKYKFAQEMQTVDLLQKNKIPVEQIGINKTPNLSEFTKLPQLNDKTIVNNKEPTLVSDVNEPTPLTKDKLKKLIKNNIMKINNIFNKDLVILRHCAFFNIDNAHHAQYDEHIKSALKGKKIGRDIFKVILDMLEHLKNDEIDAVELGYNVQYIYEELSEKTSQDNIRDCIIEFCIKNSHCDINDELSQFMTGAHYMKNQCESLLTYLKDYEVLSK